MPGGLNGLFEKYAGLFPDGLGGSRTSLSHCKNLSPPGRFPLTLTRYGILPLLVNIFATIRTYHGLIGLVSHYLLVYRIPI